MPSNYKDIIIGVLSLVAAIILVFIASEKINKIDQSNTKIASVNAESDINNRNNIVDLSNKQDEEIIISTYDLCVEKSKPFREFYYINESECRQLSYEDFNQDNLSKEKYSKIISEYNTKYSKAASELLYFTAHNRASVLINGLYYKDGDYYIEVVSKIPWRYPDCEVQNEEKEYKDYWGEVLRTKCVNGENEILKDFPNKELKLSRDIKIHLRSDNFDDINLYSLNPKEDFKFLEYFLYNHRPNTIHPRIYILEIVDGYVTKIVEEFQQ